MHGNLNLKMHKTFFWFILLSDLMSNLNKNIQSYLAELLLNFTKKLKS